MFISKKQICWAALGNIIDGTPIEVFLSNPNILLYSFRNNFSNPHTKKRYAYDKFAAKVSRISSSRNLESLRARLICNDDIAHLPRIMFCSLAWVQPTSEADSEMNVKDHKFTVIKHSNDRFQLVQGYVAESATTMNNCGQQCIPSKGFDLRRWQESENIYSSSNGFNYILMSSFLKGMYNFCEDSSFDAVGYASLFGVQPEGGHKYWPSFIYQELTDDVIIGCGERPVADALKMYLNDQTINRNI
jgi:hypothetical protein